ncbi:MAG: helix-turn-helix domain-containing protein [Nocardioides sp.]|nr:helix-turn-helix domain-containing protein [Nocardioides sp.]
MEQASAAADDERTQRRRGVLYPARLPTFRRVDPPLPVLNLVRWFWIPEWDLAEGRASRQHLIAFPALNLVIEHGSRIPPGMVGLSGPTTQASSRDLYGRGWAVGALLRPAAIRAFTQDPRSLADDYVTLELPDLHARVSEAMRSSEPDELRHAAAVATFTTWLVGQVPEPTEEALLANRLAEIIDLDREVLRVEDAAERIGVSVRTVQRLARRYVGLTPAAMIRRRRLQESAERLRLDPTLDLATLAVELGYSDQAHLARDFRSTLSASPSRYRSDASE